MNKRAKSLVILSSSAIVEPTLRSVNLLTPILFCTGFPLVGHHHFLQGRYAMTFEEYEARLAGNMLGRRTVSMRLLLHMKDAGHSEEAARIIKAAKGGAAAGRA